MTNLQQIMVRAHQIARQCEGNYSVRLTIGLRQAWTEHRLVAAGGSLWQKSGMCRVYFNGLARWFGLECDCYKTGNIAYATLNGERISNTQAGKIAGRFGFSKLYFDLTDHRYHGQGMSKDDLDTIVAKIRTAAKAA